MQQQTNPPNTDEIDLYQLFIKSVLFFRKYSKFFIIAICLGFIWVAGTYVYSLLNPKPALFSASMVITTSYSTEEIIEILHPLKNSVQNGDVEAIAAKLRLSEQEAGQLKLFTIEHLYDTKVEEYNIATTKSVPNKLIKIMVEFTGEAANKTAVSPGAFATKLRDGILVCINTNSYIKEKNDHYQSGCRMILQEIDDQLKKLNARPNSLPATMTATSSISIAAVELLQKRTKIDSACQFTKPVFIVEDFNISQVPQQPFITKKKILLYLFIFLFLPFFYALFKELKLLLPPSPYTST